MNVVKRNKYASIKAEVQRETRKIQNKWWINKIKNIQMLHKKT